MEDYFEFKDYLCYRRDKEIKDIIKEEHLLLSDKIKGLYLLNLDRNLVITNKALYSLDGKSKSFFNLTSNYRIKEKNMLSKYIRNNSK